MLATSIAETRRAIERISQVYAESDNLAQSQVLRQALIEASAALATLLRLERESEQKETQ